ncbi:hypothetical protein BDK51DRAFT_43098 [Blyttiomyces helicus]|uniref:Uncharacterized protein n=1 Tax=Blyttiomyces helicus TaxID=388810 RepID=A0A4P9WB71_9FUNG|nr:hypothetical protein BDK51DRAFT_43098 [Blyttiomyces helicus]|eukprot:RKO88835.1 hypothetical protein BDK51DRAFT_43098 [Blyttiomyces helicus]
MKGARTGTKGEEARIGGKERCRRALERRPGLHEGSSNATETSCCRNVEVTTDRKPDRGDTNGPLQGTSSITPNRSLTPPILQTHPHENRSEGCTIDALYYAEESRHHDVAQVLVDTIYVRLLRGTPFRRFDPWLNTFDGLCRLLGAPVDPRSLRPHSTHRPHPLPLNVSPLFFASPAAPVISFCPPHPVPRPVAPSSRASSRGRLFFSLT